METEAVNAAGLVAASQELNFSVWNLFLKADLIVKLVMLVLIVASVWCWAIIIEKSLRLKRLNSDAAEFEGSFWSGGSLDTLYDKIGALPKDPMAAIFVSAMKEWRRSIDSGVTSADHGSSLTDRIDRVMDVTLNREIERVERQITILASTGSTAHTAARPTAAPSLSIVKCTTSPSAKQPAPRLCRRIAPTKICF